MPGKKKSGLKTRTNSSGYREYLDPKTNTWKSTHRRVAEKKLGGLRSGFHVHHIDHNKTNNKKKNLVEVHPKVHGRLHAKSNACLRCGRAGHWARNCWAKTYYDGTPLDD